jgi:alcohol dehydrogenase
MLVESLENKRGSMRSFKHISPPLRLFHGPDSLTLLGSELERLHARRAVIFCGSSMSRDGGLLDLVRSAIEDRCVGIFDGVRAHSPLPSVEAGVRELKRLEADAVVALGGGSAIVTARAASLLLAENGDAKSLSTSQDERGELRSPKLMATKLPQLVIPTTPTTAIVKAGSAVFDPATKERLALFDPKTRAHSVFIHPAAILTAPLELVISASLDTFVLAIEALISRRGDPISDALIMQAIRLLGLHLPNLAVDRDASLRSELILAAILCGQGTDYTGAGVATALGHAISAHCGTENGVTKAIVLPYALRFSGDATRPGLEKVALSLGSPQGTSDPLAAVIRVIRAIARQLGIPQRLRDAGVPREALSNIAANSTADWWLRGNSRPVCSASELQQVLEEAW